MVHVEFLHHFLLKILFAWEAAEFPDYFWVTDEPHDHAILFGEILVYILMIKLWCYLSFLTAFKFFFALAFATNLKVWVFFFIVRFIF